MPEAKVKAEIEKPLSPEFQANRSMFRYRPESRKRNFLKSYRECHVKCHKISISCEKGEVSNFLGEKFPPQKIQLLAYTPRKNDLQKKEQQNPRQLRVASKRR